MLGKYFVGTAVSLSALVMVPSVAAADHRDGYYSRYDDGGYYRDGRRRYQRGDYYRGRGYDRYYRGRAYYEPAGSYGGYDDRRYYGRGRCGEGTTGAIVGGAAGALVGREIARDGRRYRNRGSGTVGAIVGGAVGALVGREIDRSC